MPKKSIEEILSTNDERISVPRPERLFKNSYAVVHMAADKMSEMSTVNIGNVTRAQINDVLKLLREATCNIQGLECWRKNHPHPDEIPHA